MIFSKRRTIGVFVSKVFKIFDSAVFRALQREGRRLDYDIVVFTTAGYYLTKSDYDMQEKNIFRLAAIDRLDGIIIVPGSYQHGEFRELLFDMLRNHAQCPVVAIRQESDEFDCVYTDEHVAIRPLVRHLIEDHGLRRICYQDGFKGHAEGAQRREAFLDEMQKHGLPVPEGSVCSGTMWTNCGETAYKAFFSDPSNRPEAVVCANDYMAIGLMRELRKHGIRVPEDVIVTGFDNAWKSGMDLPGISSIQPDFDGMVVEAMNHLDRRIRGAEAAPGHTRIRLPGRMILSESCGCGRRPADFFEQSSRRMEAMLEKVDDQDNTMNNMSIDLGACVELSQLHDVLVSKRTENPIVRDHYLCLFGEPGRLMDESMDRACLVHAIRDHRDCGMPMIPFERSRLLPPMAERPEEPQLLFVKLLHQNRHNFGYSVVQYDLGKVPSRTFVQANALMSIALENIHRQQELMRLYEERRLSSITDPLTGLLNRRGLMERLEPLWRDLSGRTAAFVSIDMDYLKRINDTHGHAAGDDAIRLVSRAIQQTLPPEAAGARTGGDEFLVFLPGAGKADAEAFVCAFETALAALNRQSRQPFAVTASAGYFAGALSDRDTVEHCIQASDRQLYRAKAERHARGE